jgi:hypothetical protein
MEHEAPAIFVALEHSPFAAAIRQSVWIYPTANVGHIVALVVFAGAIAVMDLRLIGVFAATVPGRIIAGARRVALAALGVLAVTGFVLFSAEASHLAVNPVFQLKMAFVAAALVNVVIYAFGAKRAVERLAPGVPMPAAARTAGLVSLAVWVLVAACGRSIAYF